MSERGKVLRRLAVAVPAGLLATLLVFVAMDYLVTSTEPRRWEKITISVKPIEKRDGPRFRSHIDLWPPPPEPELDPALPPVERQEIPYDDEAVEKLLADPERPRNANWILLQGPKPQYPPERLQQGKPGHAVLEFTITREGRTSDVRIVEQSAPGFGRAARRSVLGWRFIPRRENGRPVRSEKVRLRIEFRIEE